MSAWTWRRTIGLLGGLVALTMTRRGLGVSVGIPGLRLSRAADGALRRTFSIPGTGLRRTDRV